MNRKKSKRTSTAAVAPSPRSAQRSEAEAAPTLSHGLSDGPSPQLRTVLSIWLSIHLLAILISFTSVVEPSTIHARLSDLLHPYLRPFHFSADDRPVYLTHGDPSEKPHRVQVTTDPVTDLALADSHAWKTVGPSGAAGLAVSDRIGRWLSTAAMVSENDEPGLVAELLLPIVQHDSTVSAIRIVRLPTDLGDINEETETPYIARVIRSGDHVSLVQLNLARLSSQVVQPPKELGDD